MQRGERAKTDHELAIKPVLLVSDGGLEGTASACFRPQYCPILNLWCSHLWPSKCHLDVTLTLWKSILTPTLTSTSKAPGKQKAKARQRRRTSASLIKRRAKQMKQYAREAFSVAYLLNASISSHIPGRHRIPAPGTRSKRMKQEAFKHLSRSSWPGGGDVGMLYLTNRAHSLTLISGFRCRMHPYDELSFDT